MKKFKLRRLLFSLTLISLIIDCSAQPDLAKTKVQEKEQLTRITDAIVQPLVDSAKIAGMVVGIMRGDSILFLKSYGYADLEFNVPLPVNALFEIGSLTKQFTAVAIMQLVEKGLIKLSDNINKYLSVGIKGENITIQQLLNHTSGIGETRLGDLIYHTYPRDTLVKLVEKGQVDFSPGTAMMYNNTGYKLLGLIIEKVTGLSYEEYLSKNIYSKAGMTNTYLSDLQTVKKNRAHGYNNISKDGKLTRAEQPYFYWTFSAGALSSTVEDLLKWNHALHVNKIILPREMYLEFISPGHLTNGTPLRYAKGLQVLKYKGYNVIGHGGSGSGILCDSRYFPDQKLTIVTLQNTFRRSSESEITYAIADKLLPLKKELIEENEDNLKMYKGNYKGILEINVDVINSKLVIRKNGQTAADTLTYFGNQKWSLGSDHYSFKVENGQVKEMHWDLISAYLILNRKE